MLKKIIYILDKQDKYTIIFLILFSIFFALVETSAVAIIMPFISMVTDFSIVEQNPYLFKVYCFFEFDSKVDFIVLVGIGFIFFYIFRFFLSLFYTYSVSKFARGKYKFLSIKLLDTVMKLPYDVFTNKNSGELTKNIIQEPQNFSTSIIYFMHLLSESLVFIFIYSVMLFVNCQLTLMTSVLFGICILILYKTASKQMRKQGKERELCQKEFFASTSSVFGNFKLLKLQKSSNVFVKEYDNVGNRFYKSNIIRDIVAILPKYFMETFAFVFLFLAITLTIYTSKDNLSSHLATLSLFAVSLYRLMPSVSKIINNYNAIVYNYRAVDILYDFLSEEVETYKDKGIKFEQFIHINDVSFAYNKSDKLILDKISIKIQKSDKIAFVGESGSGKSTLVDLIIGIHQQSSGNVFVDKSELTSDNLLSWRKQIGYIPQNVYLFDGTVAENVALGLDIDENKIRDVLKKAKIYEYLNNHLDGIYTKVGDAGLKLSGGQKQRIAIARALYKDPEVLILDEATSALDEKTEHEIMNEIYEISENKTLIIIAHRLSTIKNCNKVYQVKNKKIGLISEK